MLKVCLNLKVSLTPKFKQTYPRWQNHKHSYQNFLCLLPHEFKTIAKIQDLHKPFFLRNSNFKSYLIQRNISQNILHLFFVAWTFLCAQLRGQPCCVFSMDKTAMIVARELSVYLLQKGFFRPHKCQRPAGCRYDFLFWLYRGMLCIICGIM